MITNQCPYDPASKASASNYKGIIRNNHLPPMFILKTAEPTTNSQIFRPKATHLRPLSQQRPTSINHHSPNPLRITQKSPIPRELIEMAPQGEYYTQSKPIVMDRPKPPTTSAKIIHSFSAYGSDSLESLRNSLQIMLEKSVGKFADELARQNQQIKKLQKKIQYQNQEIQTKNHIIKSLMGKCHRGRDSEYRGPSVEARKIDDLQRKMQVLVQQMEEERAATNQKLEHITGRLIVHISGKLNAAKTALANFIIENSKRIDKLGTDVTAINSKQSKRVLLLHQELESLHNHLKILEQRHSAKENCCQINSSKDTAAHNSFVSSNNRDNLFFSDYFFHPAELDSPIIKAMEELAKQRADQLPIRVYVDEAGRLKYSQSRTLIFDRKGNFVTPGKDQLVMLEQRGWVKVCGP